MFRVYKPKNFVKVRALQVTKENVNDVAGLLLGRVAFSQEPVIRGEAPTSGPEAIGVDIPTFDGIMHFPIGEWVLRSEDNTLSRMSAGEFENTYEVARNMTGGNTN